MLLGGLDCSGITLPELCEISYFVPLYSGLEAIETLEMIPYSKGYVITSSRLAGHRFTVASCLQYLAATHVYECRQANILYVDPVHEA